MPLEPDREFFRLAADFERRFLSALDLERALRDLDFLLFLEDPDLDVFLFLDRAEALFLDRERSHFLAFCFLALEGDREPELLFLRFALLCFLEREAERSRPMCAQGAKLFK